MSFDQLEAGQPQRSLPDDWVVWLCSLIVHTAMLVLMALIVFPSQRARLDFLIIQSDMGDSKGFESLETIEIQPPKLNESQLNDVAALEIATSKLSPDPSPLDIDIDQQRIAIQVEAEKFLGHVHTLGDLAGRTEKTRLLLAQAFGGSATTEAAVASGLDWLARHQKDDGGWSFDHRHEECEGDCNSPGDLDRATVGATAMALLCFLGAGNTPSAGKYQTQVSTGLKYLLAEYERTERTGDLRQLAFDNSGMYVQCLATIAICEAYGLTRDKELGKVAQQCVNFLLDAQHPQNGGWRYQPQSEVGDTSVVGWAVMAMTSAKMARLSVQLRHHDRAMRFLDSVELERGAYYGYVRPEKSLTTTAVGLLCRMYLGWSPNRPAMIEGVKYLSASGPSRDNMYYNYYASQVLHHWGGEEWDAWNRVMRDQLLTTQSRQGHSAGSWAPRDPHAKRGGRHYMTCLAIMTLEVYYRHLPLYQERSLGSSKD